MTEISFTIANNGRCTTDCPFGEINPSNSETIKVGSIRCDRCDYRINKGPIDKNEKVHCKRTMKINILEHL